MTSSRARRALRANLVLVDGRTLGEAEEAWQTENVFGPLDAADPDGGYRFRLLYYELARGHAKTTITAAEALVSCATERDTIVCCAAVDRDQARILLRMAAGFIERTPGLRALFDVQRDKIICPTTGSEIRVLSADAPSAYGLGGESRSVIFVCDELWAWPNAELFDAIWTSVGKVPRWRVIVLSNSGFDRESVAFRVREMCRKRVDPTFYLYSPRGVQAAWLGPAWQKMMRATLPEPVYRRLILNEWVTENEEGINDAMLRACTDKNWNRQQQGDPAAWYTVGVDFGATRDKTAIAVVHHDFDQQHTTLDELIVLRGTRSQPVSVTQVEEIIADLLRRFQVEKVIVDPYQLLGVVQRLGNRAHQYTFTATSRQQLAEVFFGLISAGRLRLWPDPTLARGLKKLRFKQVPTGYVLEHATGDAHDEATAIGLACWWYARPEAKPRAVLSFGTVATAPGGGIPGVTAVGVSQGGRPVHYDKGLLVGREYPRCDACAHYHDANLTCQEAVSRGVMYTQPYPHKPRSALQRILSGLP